MYYNKLSENSAKYIFTIYLLLAILINLVIIALSIIVESMVELKYKLVFNLVLISVIIIIYIFSILKSTLLISNYSYIINDNKIESIRGAFIVKRDIMLLKNVYKIEINRRIISRIFKVADIKFISCGGTIKLKYIGYDKLNKIENIIQERMCNI